MNAVTDIRGWDEPGVETVAPGVHRIPLPLPNDGLRAVNVYAIEDSHRGLVLIDGGWSIAESLATLEAGLAELDHDLGAIRRILVTHIHRDHYTQAVEIRRRVGARVGLGVGERRGLRRLVAERADRPRAALRGLRSSGAPELATRLERSTDWDPFVPADWQAPDDWLSEGDLHVGDRTLRVVATPGHTQGHVVYVDQHAGLCFSGDHVLPHITPSIGLEEVDGGLPLRDFLESLDRIANLTDARLLPAHGPTAPSAHQRVHELRDHHDARLAACMDAVSRRVRASAAEVASDLPWTRRGRAFSTLDDFNQLLAIRETAAHLDLLVYRGRLWGGSTDGVYWYEHVTPGDARPEWPLAGQIRLQ